MSGSQDEILPPPPPPPSSTPTQQTPHTVSTIKLPILKKGEYDIWAMKMEHYLAHTNYPIWEVIQNGNGPVSITIDTSGQIKFLPPRTAKEIVARERERKAKTTLLIALPKDHLAKFHKMTDAKEMWDAIKSRFGGNDESKKMQKYILKQKFKGFTVSNTEGLHKGYDRFQSLLSQLEIHRAGVSTEDANQKFLRSLPSAWSQVSLIMRTKPGMDSLSFDDLYNNLIVFKSDVKGSTTSSSSPQNVAFISENTSSTNDVSTAYDVSNTSKQLDEYNLKEMDLKRQVAMILMRMKKFYKKTGRKLQFDAKEPVGFDKTKVECYNCHKTGHFARECRIKGNQDNRRRDAWNSRNKDGSRNGKKEESKALVTVDGEGVDWTNHSEEDEDYALMACNGSDSDTEVTSCSTKCKESYANLKKLYNAQREQLSDASIEIKAYSQGLKKVEAQLVAHQQGQLWYEQKIKFMKIDLDDKTDVLTYHKKLLAEAQKEKDDLKAKVEKWHNSFNNLGKLLNSQMSAYAKFGLGYGDHRYNGILSYENKVLQSVFKGKESDFENPPLYEALRKKFAQDTENLVIQVGAARASSTNIFSTVSTPANASSTNLVNIISTPVSTVSPHEGLTLSEPTNPEQDDSKIPPLEDIYQNSIDGIFNNSSYDDECAVADFTNLETVVNVSPIPTSRIHSSHPSALILGDPTSTVQTRSNMNKSFRAHAFVSYVQKQRRTNHKDFQHCLFACFLSQNESKKISEALEDESWVDAMQEELLQFQIRKFWVLVDLPYGKKAISTKLEAIRIFLAFASYMGFIVYQMDVKSAFLYGKIDEEVYVSQPPGFLDPKYLEKVYKVVKALYGLHQAPRACVKTASTPIETQKPLVKDEEASDVDVHLYSSSHSKDLSLSAIKRIFLDNSDYAGANLTGNPQTKEVVNSCRDSYLQCKKQTNVATLLQSRICCSMLAMLAVASFNGFKNQMHHFIQDAYEKKLIQVLKIHTNDNVADLLTKEFDSKKIAQVVMAWIQRKNSLVKHFEDMRLCRPSKEYLPVWFDLPRDESMSCLTTKGMRNNGAMCARHITAKVAGKFVSISEASIRTDLIFDDADGIDSLPNQAIFDAIQLMGYEGDLNMC
ncbi:ribonuclease H-like domain-containing protein [Tanacetum coccineum]